jgi:phage I-like protein/cation transport regulator ChaB
MFDQHKRSKNMKRFSAVTELPEAVRSELPAPAQAVYMARYNEAYEKYSDDKVADILAWEAVKLQFVKKGSNWEKKQTALSRLVLESGDKENRVLWLLSEVDVMSPDIGAENRMRTWVDACVEGTWQHDEYGKLTITPKTMQQMMANFRGGVLGTEPPVDYQHLSMDPFAAADDTRAAGWIKDLKLEARNTPVAVEKDGTIVYESRTHLLALVEWTEEAWSAVSDRQFRYISPAFDTNHTDRRNGDKVGACLLGIAITNTPFLTGLSPIVASKRSMTVKATDGKPVQGGRVEELIGLVKGMGLTFDALVSKLTAAGVTGAREAAAFLLLIVSGKIPADAANAPVAVADLESIGAKSWADELTAAGTTTVTINAPADAEVTKAVTALKSSGSEEKPADGESGTPPPQAPPAGAQSTGQPTSKTVTKTESVKVEFTRDGKNESIVLGTGERLLAERNELVQLRKERLEAQIVLLSKPNKDGYGLPPVSVEMVRAFLTRTEGEAIKLTKDVTEPDTNAAFLRLMTEVRDRGLVKLSEQASTESKPGAKKGNVEGLEYGVENVPADVMARYTARYGETVTARDVCVKELMDKLMAADVKLTVDEAKRKAEKAVADSEAEA